MRIEVRCAPGKRCVALSVAPTYVVAGEPQPWVLWMILTFADSPKYMPLRNGLSCHYRTRSNTNPLAGYLVRRLLLGQLREKHSWRHRLKWCRARPRRRGNARMEPHGPLGIVQRGIGDRHTVFRLHRQGGKERVLVCAV